MALTHDPRLAQLQMDYTALMQLPQLSDFISIEPVDARPGWPPERYLVTFTCEGIAGIDANGEPRKSSFHQVSMYLSRNYPVAEPELRWLTDIWHPNIDHKEPRHVCTNAVEFHHSSLPPSELVRFMGELVSYQRYHARPVKPFPLNKEAAQWVLDVAEPRGWVAPDKPVDDRPLLREGEIVQAAPLPPPPVVDAPQTPVAQASMAAPEAGAGDEEGELRIELGQFRRQEAAAPEDEDAESPGIVLGTVRR
jgi:ubiquitin-protein ligase